MEQKKGGKLDIRHGDINFAREITAIVKGYEEDYFTLAMRCSNIQRWHHDDKRSD
jgi:hypothetical protein